MTAAQHTVFTWLHDAAERLQFWLILHVSFTVSSTADAAAAVAVKCN
jgi:hypothetical protein